MANEILLNYIRNGIQNGVSKDTLRENARSKGYPAADVEQALTQTSAESPIVKKNIPAASPKSLFIIAGAAVVLLILIGGIIAFFAYMKKTSPQEEDDEGFSFTEIVSNDVSQLRSQHLEMEAMRWVSTVVSCEAVVADDASKCTVLKNETAQQWCVSEYSNSKLTLSNISNYFTDCSKLRGSPEFGGALDEQSCAKIKRKDCSGLGGLQNSFCMAIVEDPAQCGAFLPDKQKCERQFTLARAVIFKDEKLCENPTFASNLSYVETCKGIVRKDCNDIFHRITNDLSIIDYVKAAGETERCSTVKTEKLREACLNTSLTYNDTYVSLGAPFRD